MKVNKIDQYNDREYERAKAAGDTHMKLLHPTKGFRRVSFKRMEAGAEGVVGMTFKIASVLRQAHLNNISKKDEDNGNRI